MAIYITDEIKPNGNSFPIADANNLKGGWHTVNTFSDLSKIHLSKLIDGMPCYVKGTKKTYQYAASTDTWNEIIFSAEDTNQNFKCTINGIDENAVISEGIGNLPNNLKKSDMEEMSINEILTKILFKEDIPSYTLTMPIISTKQPQYEIGSTITTYAFTFTPGTIKIKYIKNSETGTLSENTYNIIQKPLTNINFTTGSTTYTVNSMGSVQNIVNATIAVENPTPMQLEADELNTYNILTSWGNTIETYNKTHTNKINLNLTNYDNIVNMSTPKINGGVTGYYTIFFYNEENQEACSLSEYELVVGDIVNYKYSVQMSTPSLTFSISPSNITTKTPFIFVLVPESKNITQVQMYNSLTKGYSNISSTWFGKVKGESVVRVVNGKTLYQYNVWYIQKSEKGAGDKVTASTSNIKITIS